MPTTAPAPPADFQPSSQQRDIFSWFGGGRGNLVVRARAGTGKTTSIIRAIDYAPERKILLAAFNKKIAQELGTRIRNPRAEAKTLHALGFGYLRQARGNFEINEGRGFDIALEVAGNQAPTDVVRAVRDIAAIGKNAAPRASVADLARLAVAYDLALDTEWAKDGWDTKRLAELAAEAMEIATEDDGEIDFDDMIYIPVRCQQVRPRYDLVVVDEAQDMCATQLELALGACLQGGRVVVVGDDKQAIYGFRGADSSSIDRLKTELKAAELPLTITYRCPRLIVEEVHRLVPDFTAAPGAPEGAISDIFGDALYAAARPGDFVLSRKNAPLARVCIRFLMQGVRCSITGRDIGKGLIALVKQIRGRAHMSVVDFLGRLESWREKQTERARQLEKKAAVAKIGWITDQADTLITIAADCSSVDALERKIGVLFTETGDAMDRIVCSSVHKAKGLERERVFGLVDTLYLGGQREDVEEQNIEYVMLTRAQREFVRVLGIS
jgi:DNA helicase-2/ATP-dependent DNA helicase PcrA